MPNNSAIPATARLPIFMSLVEWEEQYSYVVGKAKKESYPDARNIVGGCWVPFEAAENYAIQTIKSLEPAARVEVIKELAKGLEVAVVPREPTEAMLKAGQEASTSGWVQLMLPKTEEVYRAMIADSQGER